MQQLVKIFINLAGDDIPKNALESRIDELQEALEELLTDSAIGEFDGDSWGPDDCELYLYGPDCDKLYQHIEPLVIAAKLPNGSYAIKQYGEPGAPETRVTFLTSEL